MAQDDPYLRDLLKPRRSSKMPAGIAVLAILVLGLGGLMILLSGDDEQPHKAQAHQPQTTHITHASTLVFASIEAARMPLKVAPAPTEEPETVKPSTAQEVAVWEDGKATTLNGALAKNESVSLALQRRNISSRDIHLAVSSMAKVYNFRTSRPGDQWLVEVDEQGQITRFRYQTSLEDIWETTKQGDDYVAEKIKVPLEHRIEVASGYVEASLWDSLSGAGLSSSLTTRFLDAFSPAVDFGQETQPGDRFSVVYEEIYLDGQKLRDGRLLAAAYESSQGLYQAFGNIPPNTDEADNTSSATEYFDDQGQSLKYSFLKSPLTNVRITSRFGMRFHPVLKRNKPHNGVDYGASTGTPVMSVADGTVVFAGWKGANGKLVVLKHENGLTTHYAHLSYIPRTLKRGKEVKQKELIGHVGSTGRSTGPHLHYGVKDNGKWVDPLGVKFRRAAPLKGRERQVFLSEIVAPLQRKLGIEEGHLKVRGTFNSTAFTQNMPAQEIPFDDF